MSPQTDKEVEEMKQIPYKEAVGALLYISTSTRPDISYAVGQVAKFNHNPGFQHWKAVKRIRYVVLLHVSSCDPTLRFIIWFE